MEFDSKNAAHREIERGINSGEYRTCVHLNVLYNQFEGEYVINCGEDSFEESFDTIGIMSGVVRCPSDCRFFADKEQAEQRELEAERQRRAEQERQATLARERRKKDQDAEKARDQKQAEERRRQEQRQKVKYFLLWLPRTMWKAFLQLQPLTQIAVIATVAIILLVILAPTYVPSLVELLNALKGVIHGDS